MNYVNEMMKILRDGIYSHKDYHLLIYNGKTIDDAVNDILVRELGRIERDKGWNSAKKNSLKTYTKTAINYYFRTVSRRNKRRPAPTALGNLAIPSYTWELIEDE